MSGRRTRPGFCASSFNCKKQRSASNSGWNRTTQWHLGGPVGAEYWQFRKATVSAGTVWLNIRIWAGQIFFEPTPSSAQTIAFEYASTSWIKPSGQTIPTSDLPSLAIDVVCFDNLLAVAMLKLAWLRAKQMDTTTVQYEYDEALEQAMSADATTPLLSLNGGAGVPLLGYFNIPDTGYGH